MKLNISMNAEKPAADLDVKDCGKAGNRLSPKYYHVSDFPKPLFRVECILLRYSDNIQSILSTND